MTELCSLLKGVYNISSSASKTAYFVTSIRFSYSFFSGSPKSRSQNWLKPCEFETNSFLPACQYLHTNSWAKWFGTMVMLCSCDHADCQSSEFSREPTLPAMVFASNQQSNRLAVVVGSPVSHLPWNSSCRKWMQRCARHPHRAARYLAPSKRRPHR